MAAAISIKQAERLLGVKPIRFTLKLSLGVARGFLSNRCFEHEEAVAHVLERQAEAASLGVCLFCGSVDRVLAGLRHLPGPPSGLFIHVVPGITQVEVAELADTGVPDSYSPPEAWAATLAGDPDDELVKFAKSRGITPEELAGPPPDKARRRVRKFLTTVYNRHPFRVFFADRKGLIARFDEPLDEKAAAKLESEIVWVNSEAFDAVAPLTMKEYILQKQELRLWWD